MIDLAKYRLPFFFFVLIFVGLATFATIKFNQGYRLDLTNKKLKPTGLLVADSIPSGAQVFINGKLSTATNNTISLSPGKYLVEIKKNGFTAWKKELTIEKELVTQTEAFLFPLLPDLKPLTFSGVEKPVISPDGTKLVYSVPLPKDQNKNLPPPNDEAGLWVMDLTDFIFNINREPKQIVKSWNGVEGDFSKANYSWTPDSKQILVEFAHSRYLLDSTQLNNRATLHDITLDLPKIIEQWNIEKTIREQAKMKKMPEKMQEILKENATEIEFSPDGTKALYKATSSAEIPEKLIPPVLAASTQKENRQLKPGKIYVYDLKEDKNFLIPYDLPPISPTLTPKSSKNKNPTPSPFINAKYSISDTIKWFPTSRHLYWMESDKDGNSRVIACEYDGNNVTTVYAGPFLPPYAFIAPGANRLIVLTQISANSETVRPNLYSISLK